MPRQKRADEAGSIYHALNRGNARQTIFHKDEDYEAFLRVLGEGHLYQSRFKSFPVADNDHWIERVNQLLSEQELQALRECVGRARPFGDPDWTAKVVQRTDLGYTLRPRGRPRRRQE